MTHDTDLGAIGPYRPLKLIGENDTSNVYLARQDQPVDRLASLAVLKPGLGTARDVSRFEAQRRTLSLITHPNIPSILDVGTTEDGRPYFAMELVRGAPLTRHCDERRLSLRRRLELFLPICDAVQHAHHRGVIHGDLSPTTVLVEVTEGKAWPRVIGFARIPVIEIVPGAGDSHAEIDTRTDVFGLGVILYELLTGAAPFGPEEEPEGQEASTGGTRERRPLPPSKRAVHGSYAAAARDRRREPDALAKALHGELDWIVTRALERHPARRYATPSALADDIRRFLRDEPVDAAPPGLGYRIRKLARRHRGATVALGTTAVLLVTGTLAVTWQAIQASRAESIAVQEAAVSRAVNQFLVQMLSEANPESSPYGSELTVSQLLDRAAARVSTNFKGPPEVEAALLGTIGTTYSVIGRDSSATRHLTRARDLARTLGDRATLESLLDLADHDRRNHRLSAAEANARHALEVAGQGYGEESTEHSEATLTLAAILLLQDKFAEAETLFEESLRNGEDRLASGDPRFVNGLDAYARLLHQLGVLDRAEANSRLTLTLFERTLGHDSPAYGRALGNLARVLRDQGRSHEALPLFEEATTIVRLSLGDEHPALARIYIWHADALEAVGEPGRATPLIRRAVDILTAAYGERSPEVATALGHWGSNLQRRGDLEGAEAAYREALGIAIETYGEGPDLFHYVSNLSDLLRVREQYDEAEEGFRTAHRYAVEIYGADHRVVASTTQNLARTLTESGKFAQSESTYLAAIDIASRSFPADHPSLDVMRGNYADCLVRAGKYTEAGEILDEVWETLREKLGATHHDTRAVAVTLAQLHEALGRDGEAGAWRMLAEPR